MNKKFTLHFLGILIFAALVIFNGQTLKKYEFNSKNSELLEGITAFFTSNFSCFGPNERAFS